MYVASLHEQARALLAANETTGRKLILVIATGHVAPGLFPLLVLIDLIQITGDILTRAYTRARNGHGQAAVFNPNRYDISCELGLLNFIPAAS